MRALFQPLDYPQLFFALSLEPFLTPLVGQHFMQVALQIQRTVGFDDMDDVDFVRRSGLSCATRRGTSPG